MGEMDGSARWGHLVMMTIIMTLMMIMMIHCGWYHLQVSIVSDLWTTWSACIAQCVLSMRKAWVVLLEG